MDKKFYNIIIVFILIFMVIISGVTTIGYLIISVKLDNVIAGQALIDEHLTTPKKFVIYYDPASDNKAEITMKEIEKERVEND